MSGAKRVERLIEDRPSMLRIEAAIRLLGERLGLGLGLRLCLELRLRVRSILDRDRLDLNGDLRGLRLHRDRIGRSRARPEQPAPESALARRLRLRRGLDRDRLRLRLRLGGDRFRLRLGLRFGGLWRWFGCLR